MYRHEHDGFWSTVVRAEVTDRSDHGVVFMSIHSAEGAAKLTQEEFDPISGIPEYKVSSVRIEPTGDATGMPADD